MNRIKIGLGAGLVAFVIIAASIALMTTRASPSPEIPNPGHSWDQIECDNNLCVDTVNSRVGIGTSNPGAKLDVVGNVKIADGTQGDGKVLTSDLNGVASWQETEVPSGAVMFFNLASCPSGWSELTDARGRYLVGLPSGGTLAGTKGTALNNLENRAVGKHSHVVSDPGHRHTRDNRPSGFAYFQNVGDVHTCVDQVEQGVTGISQTGVTINDAGSVGGTNAPYMQLLVCQKD